MHRLSQSLSNIVQDNSSLQCFFRHIDDPRNVRAHLVETSINSSSRCDYLNCVQIFLTILIGLECQQKGIVPFDESSVIYVTDMPIIKTL